jgi:hypothetical protein
MAVTSDARELKLQERDSQRAARHVFFYFCIYFSEIVREIVAICVMKTSYKLARHEVRYTILSVSA